MSQLSYKLKYVAHTTVIPFVMGIYLRLQWNDRFQICSKLSQEVLFERIMDDGKALVTLDTPYYQERYWKVIWLQKQPGRCNKCVTFGTRNGEVQSKCCSNKCWELWCENQKWNTSEKANRIITTGLPRAGSLSPCILKARDLRAKVVYWLPHGVRREARAKKPIWGLPRAGLLSLCIYLEGTVRPKVVYRLLHGIYCCS
jgi:hypothetical protein